MAVCAFSSLVSVFMATDIVSCVLLFSWLKVYRLLFMLLGVKNACMFQDLHTRGFSLDVHVVLLVGC